VSPEEAMNVCRDGGCVWIKDYADENYGDEDDPHYDYPVEDPDELLSILDYMPDAKIMV
jgi:hypothetical protein